MPTESSYKSAPTQELTTKQPFVLWYWSKKLGRQIYIRRPGQCQNTGLPKLTVEQAQAIRADRAVGESLRVIARKYGVSAQTVSDVVKGKSWRKCLPPVTTVSEVVS